MNVREIRGYIDWMRGTIRNINKRTEYINKIYASLNKNRKCNKRVLCVQKTTEKEVKEESQSEVSDVKRRSSVLKVLIYVPYKIVLREHAVVHF